MQTRAILGAALELKKEGIEAKPEIMVPLTGILYEFKEQEKVIRKAAAQLFEEMGDSIDFKVGTMIEIPRAALTADRIASSAEFFSFGTDDLRLLSRRYRFLPAGLPGKEDSESRSVPGSRPEWSRTIGPYGYRKGACYPSGLEMRYLRRAWR